MLNKFRLLMVDPSHSRLTGIVEAKELIIGGKKKIGGGPRNLNRNSVLTELLIA
jgi:hypothetical protein